MTKLMMYEVRIKKGEWESRWIVKDRKGRECVGIKE
jgi:hypothetical protein